MQTRIGIDLVHISRFQHEMKLNTEYFYQHVFSQEELKIHTKIESLAGAFAAKEACIKANPSFQGKLSDLKILKTKTGRPYLDNPAFSPDNGSVDISISHDGEYAIAICQTISHANTIQSTS